VEQGSSGVGGGVGRVAAFVGEGRTRAQPERRAYPVPRANQSRWIGTGRTRSAGTKVLRDVLC
jgi:hypothetical protein